MPRVRYQRYLVQQRHARRQILLAEDERLERVQQILHLIAPQHNVRVAPQHNVLQRSTMHCIMLRRL